MTAPPALPHRDGVALAHALAWAVAERAGIRALLIKGPAASHHGLRAERVSADADIWVDPDAFPEYVGFLTDLGWQEQPVSRTHRSLVLHSVTVTHPGWPCSIDVHDRFPGFLVEPQRSFDALWERREPLQVAGVAAAIPDRASSVLVATLHALRTPAQTARHADEMRTLVDDVLPRLTREEREDLRDLALRTGAIDAARPVLDMLGVALPAPTPAGADPELDAWRQRIGGRGSASAQFVIHIRSLPWRERPGAAWRAVWPSEADFRAAHTEVSPGWWNGVAGRLTRLGRGFRAIPTVIHGAVLARRGVTDDSLLRTRD